MLKVVVAYVLFLGTKAIRFQIWGLRASAKRVWRRPYVVATLPVVPCGNKAARHAVLALLKRSQASTPCVPQRIGWLKPVVLV